MKTAKEIHIDIGEEVRMNFTDQDKRLIKLLDNWEKEIRADERKTRIKELNSMGEFKTGVEAKEYCRLHGLDESATLNNVYLIAGSLMDARKDQDRITRESCLEEIRKLTTFHPFGTIVAVKINEVIQVIMNTKTI